MNVQLPLKHFITRQVAQVIKIQENYNNSFLEDLNVFIREKQAEKETMPLLEKVLIPERISIKEYELSCRFQMQQSKGKGFQIQINPLPVQYAVLFSEEETQSAQIKIQVNQVHVFPEADK